MQSSEMLSTDSARAKSFTSATKLFLIGILSCIWWGCDRGKSSSSSSPREPETKPVELETDLETRKAARLAWNRKTLGESYRNAGKRNTAWDSEAEKALEAFANIRAGAREENLFAAIRDSARAAVTAGCDDPLITYLHARFVGFDSALDPVQLAEKASTIAEQLNTSAYPSLRRFYGCLRAAEASVVTIGSDNKIPPRLIALRFSTTTNLLSALGDMSTPFEEIFEAIDQWLPTAKRSARQFAEDMKFIDPALKNWPEAPPILLARATCALDSGWNARGTGYANTVTPEGAKVFDQRLNEARQLLEKTWKSDPSNPRVAEKMLSVTLGLGLPRKEMETWFERAMKLDTNSYSACEGKLFYLKPQWYGSDKDIIQFGRECVTSSSWGGRVPLILVDAHSTVAAFLPAEKKAGYWKSASVWKDVQSSYEKFFALNPDNVSYRHDYAGHAFQAEQWETFNRQLPLFTTGTNYGYWGSKKKFDEMVAWASQAAGRNNR